MSAPVLDYICPPETDVPHLLCTIQPHHILNEAGIILRNKCQTDRDKAKMRMRRWCVVNVCSGTCADNVPTKHNQKLVGIISDAKGTRRHTSNTLIMWDRSWALSIDDTLYALSPNGQYDTPDEVESFS